MKVPFTTLATIVAASMAFSTAGADDNDRSYGGRKGSIQGVWLLEVTLLNCSTGTPVGAPPFPVVNTFHEGGTMSEHGSRLSPALRNSGQGVWKQVGRDRYTSRFLFQRFDANGLYIGAQEVERKMKLSDDGKTLSITAKVRIVDMNGVLISQGCAAEEGLRF